MRPSIGPKDTGGRSGEGHHGTGAGLGRGNYPAADRDDRSGSRELAQTGGIQGSPDVHVRSVAQGGLERRSRLEEAHEEQAGSVSTTPAANARATDSDHLVVPADRSRETRGRAVVSDHARTRRRATARRTGRDRQRPATASTPAPRRKLRRLVTARREERGSFERSSAGARRGASRARRSSSSACPSRRSRTPSCPRCTGLSMPWTWQFRSTTPLRGVVAHAGRAHVVPATGQVARPRCRVVVDVDPQPAHPGPGELGAKEFQRAHGAVLLELGELASRASLAASPARRARSARLIRLSGVGTCSIRGSRGRSRPAAGRPRACRRPMVARSPNAIGRAASMPPSPARRTTSSTTSGSGHRERASSDDRPCARS